MNRKPIIAVDVDDVLKDTSQQIVEFSNLKWGTNLKVEDYTEHWASMWEVDHKEATQREEEVLLSIVGGDPLAEDVADILRRLSERFTLIVTTSRSKVISQDTHEWLELHFKDIFSSVNFAGIWDGEGDGSLKLKATKASLLKQLGADYLIDDHPKHCLAAAEKGIEAILFGEYPWNKLDHLPPGVSRCKNWKAVEEYFDAR